MRTEAAGCQQRLLKRAKMVVELLAYQAEMGERRAAIKSPAPIYGRISRLSGQRRGEEREGSSFLHSVLTSLFLGVAHISRNDRIIFQTLLGRLCCPAGMSDWTAGICTASVAGFKGRLKLAHPLDGWTEYFLS